VENHHHHLSAIPEGDKLVQFLCLSCLLSLLLLSAKYECAFITVGVYDIVGLNILQNIIYLRRSYRFNFCFGLPDVNHSYAAYGVSCGSIELPVKPNIVTGSLAPAHSPRLSCHFLWQLK